MMKNVGEDMGRLASCSSSDGRGSFAVQLGGVQISGSLFALLQILASVVFGKTMFLAKVAGARVMVASDWQWSCTAFLIVATRSHLVG